MASRAGSFLFDLQDLPDPKGCMASLIAASQNPPAGCSGTPMPAPEHATVVGAGLMGRGIAYALASTGIRVELVDSSPAQLTSSLSDMNRWDRRATATRASLVHTSAEPDAAWKPDLCIEAVPEDLDLKRSVFATLSANAKPGTILASNTSTLDIDAIAAATTQPERVIGTHFLLPAQVTPLLEIVPGRLTAPETTLSMMKLASAMGKVAVLAGNCDGFIGNRLFDRWHQEAMYLLEEGGTPEQIDAALENWGMTIGPFRTLDMIDNRLLWGVRRRRAQTSPALHQPLIGDRLCEAGFAGRATHAGWYLYDSDTPARSLNPAVDALAGQCAADQSIIRRPLDEQDIITRCLVAVIHEGLSIVREGYCRQPGDIDLTFCLGYGFPGGQGGPLRLASRLDTRELSAISSRCEAQAGRGKSRILDAVDLAHLGLALPHTPLEQSDVEAAL